jgi:hypothetical protein
MVYMSKQPLRGVGVAAVTGVDHMHMRRHVLRDQVGRATFGMAHDEHVGVHRTQVGDGVEQAFALGRAALGDVQVDDIGAQALGRDFERGARACAVFKEQVEHALATQQRHLLHVAVVDAEKGAGGVEDLRQHGLGQAFNAQQVDQLTVFVELRVASRKHQACSPRLKWKTPSSVRASDKRRAAGSTSLAAEKAAAMGSSRPPRSTSTARVTLAGRPKSNSSLTTARTVRPVYSTSSISTMWRPSMAKGKCVGSVAEASPRAEKSSRCKRAGNDTVGTWQAQVPLQAFGKPGAAAPDAHQGGLGAQELAHTLAQFGVQRFGIKLQHGAPGAGCENTGRG